MMMSMMKLLKSGSITYVAKTELLTIRINEEEATLIVYFKVKKVVETDVEDEREGTSQNLAG